MTTLKEYLLQVLNNYQSEKNNDLTGNELANFIKNQASISIPEYLLNTNDYKISASCGKGRWSEIPWMGVFHKDISISAQKGYYIVYLFRGDCKGVYISLNQGYTFYKNRFKGDKPKQKINKVSKYWSAKLNLIREKDALGFTSKPIKLHASGKKDLSEGYELGNIYSKYYSLEDLEVIDNKDLLTDMEHLKMVFAELRSLLPQNYEEFNYSIVNDYSTEELDEEIIDKNLEIEENLTKLGEKVDIPHNLKLNENIEHGKKIRKRNYGRELKRNTKQGGITEKLALQIEEDRLKMNPLLRDYVDKIVHFSLDKGDGAGYDIQSFDYDKETNEIVEYYIEVKSTTGGVEAPFYMSENELQVSKKKGKFYSIYRLYKNADNNWNYYIINDPYNNIEYKPIQYMVVPKNNL